ncbi:MAG: hypothetical protein CK532_02425 [Flavobacteriales bacterium]|nr:hypothetical protein [Flavobacteriaceae bacterium]PHX92697.1 MAG: hypothetical protein CK532_02425 [Flavobacteriales bacterium]
MRNTKLHIVFFALLSFFDTHSHAQTTGGQNITLSPYSNFGIGEWLDYDFVQNGANLHTRTGAYSYSLSNPATLGNLYYTTFNLGMSVKSSQISTSNASQTFQGGGLSYMALAFKTWDYYVRKVHYDSLLKIKTIASTRFAVNSSFSLHPISSIGYQYTIENKTPFLNRTTHNGFGGLNAIEMSHALKLGSHASIGYSASYLFGDINDQSVFSIPDSTSLHILEDLKAVSMHGMEQKLGVLFYVKKDSTYHTFGGSTQFYSNLNGQESRLTRTMELAGSNVYIVDTVLNLNTPKTAFSLPKSFGMGYTFQYRQSWSLALDYRQQDWKNNSAIFFDAGRSYTTRKDYGFTFTIHPNDIKLPKQKKIKSPIRFGAVLSETQFEFAGTPAVPAYQLAQQRAFIGFGLPIKTRYYDNTILTSLIQIQLDYTQRGTTKFGLAKEQFFMVKLGFQLGDVWFQRRKFN